MRISASLILNLIANGMASDEIIEEYPYLEAADVQAVLRYAAWATEDSVSKLELALAV